MSSQGGIISSTVLNTPVLLVASTALVGYIVYRLFFDVGYPTSIPRLYVEGKSASSKSTSYPNFTAALKSAFPKFKNAAFVVSGRRPDVWTSNVVMIPPAWIDSLKNLPDETISLQAAIFDRFNNKHTHSIIKGGSASNQAFIKTVSVDLTRHISKIMAAMDEEINHAFDSIVPPCDDWTEVYPGQILPQIVALASGRIFVGKPLCRDPDFIKATITFTIDNFIAGDSLHKYPKVLRGLIAPWSKQVRICEEQHTTMRRILSAELEKRREMSLRGEELPLDMMTWMIHNLPEEMKYDIEVQAGSQLAVSLAAIHTTTMTTSNAWLDLCAHQEYLQPLRDEWASVLATEEDNIISKASMPKLKKLDSFLKESQRVNPLGPTAFERKVNLPLTLPDGTVVPKGSYLAVAAEEIGMDKAKWGNPEEFDGFRFDKLRQQAGNESRYQFATTGPESMFFGHGPHACPGRFFAANEIKLILAYILRNYDMKFPDGQGRPANIVNTNGSIPDYTKPVLLRKRVAA